MEQRSREQSRDIFGTFLDRLYELPETSSEKQEETQRRQEDQTEEPRKGESSNTADADLFNTFLSTLFATSAAVGEARESERREGVKTATMMVQLLTNLATSGPTPVSKLADESGVDFVRFAHTLEGMQDASLVTLNGEPGKQEVEITTTGENLLRLLEAVRQAK